MRVLAVLAREIEVQATRNALDLVAGDIATDAGDVRDDLLAAPSAPLRQLAGHVADPLLQSHRGAGTVFGLDVDRDAVRLKKRIGYVPGELPQWGGWRGEEIVAYVSGIRGDVSDAEVERVAKRLDLDLSRKYREYSHGNKQKLALLL